MILIRSGLFNVALYVCNALFFVVMLPALALSYPRFMVVVGKPWMHMNMWLFSRIVGVTYEVRGRENLPSGGYMVAANHQSAWETMGIAREVPFPTYVLKQELLNVPLFGWYLKRAELIPINRGKGAAVLKEMNDRAKETVDKGRQVMIFPEGTRKDIGSEPNYKFGVAYLYEVLNLPCVPVAHNAGVCWPRKGFLKHAGKITVEILPPIPAGLPRDVFFEEIQKLLIGASERLVREGLQDRAAALKAG
jgi:1-acyl-sn-glycerol-3-phosphate acyltransferase